MPGNPKLVLTAAGFFIDGDVLRVYYGYYHYKESFLNEDGSRKEGDVCHEDTGMGYVATKGGENWSTPQDMNIPMIPNHGPQKTASGRIIITGNVIYPYTDRSDGVSGYQMTGIYGDAFQEKQLCDDSECFLYVTKLTTGIRS